jgi:hypothetical protein
MAISLTETNKELSQKISITPQAILEIEGLETIFGAQPILEFARWDKDLEWDSGIRWDGLTEKPEARSYIDLKGSTKEIKNQILPDKGGSNSISSVNIRLVDINNEVAQLLSFSNIEEILGKLANFYIGIGGAHPEDSIPIFRGVVVDFYTEDGAVMVSVAHPEALKRQVLFEQFQERLTANIDSSTTTIPVSSTTDLIESGDSTITTIRIDDEVMRVVSVDSDIQLTVERAYEGTIADNHELDADITSIFIISGDPITLALKLMLSTEGNEFFLSDDKPTKVQDNKLLFDIPNIEDTTGLVEGDLIQLTGVNAGIYTVNDFGVTSDGSFIELVESVVNEVEFTDTFEYKSKYNVMPDGLGMLPFQVDVKGHEDILAFNPSLFVDYKFYLKESVDDPQELISSELYFPQGLYAIPRKARASVKQVNPPLSVDIVPTINTENITNITRIKQRRSLHKYLYNIFRYEYEEDIIENKTLRKDIIISTDSLGRIKGGRKPLKIKSKGLRDNVDTQINIQQVSQRLVDRYRFAPTYFQGVEVNFKDGFNLEVGDVIPFGGGDTKIVDLQTGLRGQREKLFECIGKRLDIFSGKIKIDLLETAFNIDARSATISLASFTGSESTTTRIQLKKSFDVGEFVDEAEKWQQFEGEKIRVRSEDYSFDEEVIFKEIDPGNRSFMILDGALSSAPLEDYIVEVPLYDNNNADNEDKYKIRFAYFNSQVEITAVADNQTFEVDTPGELFEGSKIYVHSDNYDRDSFGEDTSIDDITGNTITLTNPLSFTPQIGDKVEFSKYLDGGDPYQII